MTKKTPLFYYNTIIRKLETIMNNLVAKHARTYNKAHVMKDRKKAAKRGYSKHKVTY